MKERKLEVWYKNRPVGLLAETESHRVAFQYDESWIENGFAISPFSLPVTNRVFIPSGMNFQGLWGVFADSLPDAWGRLLLERTLKANAIDPQQLNQLDRLAIVGANGMGGLEYVPEYELYAPDQQ